MSFELASPPMCSPRQLPWEDPAAYWAAFTRYTAELPGPVIAVHQEALRWNAHDLLRRAAGTPIRVASKSVRVRAVLDAVLSIPGYRGILAYTLAEALWLAETHTDVVVGYPSTDRVALAQLLSNPSAAERVTLMVDSVAHLDLVDTVREAKQQQPIRVCIDIDAGLRLPIVGTIGVLRSPVHTQSEVLTLATQILRRPGFTLVGVMSYEAQIAGVASQPRGKPVLGAVIRRMQAISAHELYERRAQTLEAVQNHVSLEFVNAGGTGSLESSVKDFGVTEVTAGSGLLGPHLFDQYAQFSPAPAVAFSCDVVRKPNPHTATLLGGGWIASGQAGVDRLPQPVWPPELRWVTREGAGEVQSPVQGRGAHALRVGDRVWLRHTKSGEVMEHGNLVTRISASGAVDQVPTYRGEGKSFL